MYVEGMPWDDNSPTQYKFLQLKQGKLRNNFPY